MKQMQLEIEKLPYLLTNHSPVSVQFDKYVHWHSNLEFERESLCYKPARYWMMTHSFF